MREQWRQPYTPFPRHIVRQFQSLYTPSLRGHVATPYSTSVSVPLYAITARGQLPRHIVRQFQSPYTPSPRGLSRISARQVALALASRFFRMLSFQIKEMEFTGFDTYFPANQKRSYITFIFKTNLTLG